MLLRDTLFLIRCAIASKLIHHVLLDGVMHSPMSFFDTNPLGRIINRFSADIDTVDNQIPGQLVSSLLFLEYIVCHTVTFS